MLTLKSGNSFYLHRGDKMKFSFDDFYKWFEMG